MTAILPLTVAGALTRRHGKVLVGPIDLTLQPHGVTIVMGPNGAGKTSLLRMLHGIARLGGGELTWNCAEAEARRRQAFVFQTPAMLRRSVRDNLAFPLRLHGVGRSEARARAADWADRVGLGYAFKRQATVLSGGERQKLAIGRALIREPELLFLDEPSAALDGRATREIEAILQDAAARGTRLVMSTHDVGQARRLADEVLFLVGGKLVEYARAPDFFDAPQAARSRAFLRGDIVE